MSLLSALPVPTRQHAAPVQSIPISTSTALAIGKEAPPYLRRQNFGPRRADDFGDGGAFPEIHVAQYPLDMGRDSAAKGNKTLAVTINADGQINYDAVVKQGGNRDKVVYSDHKALVPKVDLLTKEALARPDDEEVEKTTRETLAALEKVVQGKLSSTNPSNLPSQPGGSTLIKYTPAQQGPQFNSGAGQRIIKMQDMPVDPMEPPKFRHTKVPRGAGSPPVPVMHSPPRALTVKDQQDWKIPPCISNWKNPKGYTIPLDKRLAADGRGLQQTQINDKFASLSESLFTAEAKAREAIQMRAAIQKELMSKEKSKREGELRQLAMQARMERTTGAPGGRPDMPPAAERVDTGGFDGPSSRGGAGGYGRGHDDDDDMDDGYGRATAGGGAAAGGRRDGEGDYHESREEREERKRRDEIREERRRERERERRLESKESGQGAKKSKITRDRDRDIGEKVALGMANVGQGEVQYDQRLFNQDIGMASGFGADDSYSLYDKPLFADRGNANLFKPTKAAAGDEDEEGGGDEGVRTGKFRADKGFKGAEAPVGRGGAANLEFERAEQEADPFGLDQFLSEVKGKKKGPLDGIGQAGGMRAAGGGSSLDDAAAGGSGRRMQFTSGRG